MWPDAPPPPPPPPPPPLPLSALRITAPFFFFCTMFLGFRKCHKNAGAMILHFYLFFFLCDITVSWVNLLSTREKACDISRQTKIAALAVSCLPLRKRPHRWERLSFQLKLKRKWWVSANIRQQALSWQEALEMLAWLKIPRQVQGGRGAWVCAAHTMLFRETRIWMWFKSSFNWWGHLIDRCSNN